MQGTYLLCLLLILAFSVEPRLTARILTTVSLKLQVFYINYKLKWMAWRMYCQLCSMAEKAKMPKPGPFRFVDIWDRGSDL